MVGRAMSFPLFHIASVYDCVSRGQVSQEGMRSTIVFIGRRIGHRHARSDQMTDHRTSMDVHIIFLGGRSAVVVELITIWFQLQNLLTPRMSRRARRAFDYEPKYSGLNSIGQ